MERPLNTTHLIHTIQTASWQINPLIIITSGVIGAIHQQPIKDLEKLKISKNKIKALMKHLHQLVINTSHT